MVISVFEIKKGDLVVICSVPRVLVDVRSCWLGGDLGITIYVYDDMHKPIPFTYRPGDKIEIVRYE